MTSVSKYLRSAIAILLTFLAYVGCLLWAYPKEFNPLVPYRPDLYYPVGLLTHSLFFSLLYPRPVAYLFQRIAGTFGIQGSIAATIGVVLATVLVAQWVVSRITKRPASLLSFAAFLILLFSNPQFYFHHRFDVPSVVAGFFLLLAIGSANAWLEEPRPRDLVLALVFAAATALSKETYDVSLAIMLAGLCWLHWNRCGWRRAALLIGLTGVMEGVAEAYNMTRFISSQGMVSSTSTYAPDIGLASVAAMLSDYLKDVLPRGPLAAVALALLVIVIANRHRLKELIMPVTFIVAGAAALIPNALLPKHYETQYAWNAAPLLFAVVLFIPSAGRRWTAVCALFMALAVVSVRTNRPDYQSAAQQWSLNEEHGNAGIAAALPAIRTSITGCHKLLVTGIAFSFQPWGHPEFIHQYFGNDIDWTVVVWRDRPESNLERVSMLRPGNVQPDSYDGVVEFREDGTLDRVLTGAAYQNALRSNRQALLVPILAKLQADTAARPADFITLLNAGSKCASWGMPEQALLYLQRAAGVDPRNPYPWFFSGKALRDLGRIEEARAAYQKAIALDAPAPNPAFSQALAELPVK